MKITKTTTYECTFTVEAHINTEGGMDVETFGTECATLEIAITQLELARLSVSGNLPWSIIVDVKSTTK